MKPADLALVKSMYSVIAPTAAAEMKSRCVAVLRAMAFEGALAPMECNILHRAAYELELLPLSKEAK